MGEFAIGTNTLAYVIAKGPVCQIEKLSEKQKELQLTIQGNKRDGGDVYLITLTVRHDHSDKLIQLLGSSKDKTGIAGAFRIVRAHSQWKKIKQNYFYKADCRALEDTWGTINLHHVHIHQLVFTQQPLTEKQINNLKDDYFSLWIHACKKAGLKLPNKKHGIHIGNGDEAGIVRSILELWGMGTLRIYIRDYLGLDDSGLLDCTEGARARPWDSS